MAYREHLITKHIVRVWAFENNDEPVPANEELSSIMSQFGDVLHVQHHTDKGNHIKWITFLQVRDAERVIKHFRTLPQYWFPLPTPSGLNKRENHQVLPKWMHGIGIGPLPNHRTPPSYEVPLKLEALVKAEIEAEDLRDMELKRGRRWETKKERERRARSVSVSRDTSGRDQRPDSKRRRFEGDNKYHSPYRGSPSKHAALPFSESHDSRYPATPPEESYPLVVSICEGSSPPKRDDGFALSGRHSVMSSPESRGSSSTMIATSPSHAKTYPTRPPRSPTRNMTRPYSKMDEPEISSARSTRGSSPRQIDHTTEKSADSDTESRVTAKQVDSLKDTLEITRAAIPANWDQCGVITPTCQQDVVPSRELIPERLDPSSTSYENPWSSSPADAGTTSMTEDIILDNDAPLTHVHGNSDDLKAPSSTNSPNPNGILQLRHELDDLQLAMKSIQAVLLEQKAANTLLEVNLERLQTENQVLKDEVAALTRREKDAYLVPELAKAFVLVGKLAAGASR